MKVNSIRFKLLIFTAAVFCMTLSSQTSFCEEDLCSRLQGTWQHIQIKEGDENKKPENTCIDFITRFSFECVNEKRNIGKINVVTQVYKNDKEMFEYYSGYFVVSRKNEKELILDFFVSRDGELTSTDGKIINWPTKYSEIVLILNDDKSITIRGKAADLNLNRISH